LSREIEQAIVQSGEQRGGAWFRRILVVDDEAAIRDLLVDVLQMEGFVVDAAGHGAEALDIASAHRPDLVLLDLMMPVMDGRQFVERCRRMPALAALPIVLMSAAADGHAASREIGAWGFLPKPFDFDDLAQVLRRVM
jgi:CheY-like chemotaxis protein